MTALLFIIIVTSVLILLIYWVLANIKETETIRTKIPNFNYEMAPELSTYGASELYLAQNSIKFAGNDSSSIFAYWRLEQEKLAEVADQNHTAPDTERIVLRLYEVNDWLRYFDIHVKSISGRCRFELQPGISYYVVLGLNLSNSFIPILTSETIRKSS